MEKPEVGAPKYLAMKMKTKWLQKLNWYCEVCHEHCQDESEFKYHTLSESHQRRIVKKTSTLKRSADETLKYEYKRYKADVAEKLAVEPRYPRTSTPVPTTSATDNECDPYYLYFAECLQGYPRNFKVYGGSNILGDILCGNLVHKNIRPAPVIIDFELVP